MAGFQTPGIDRLTRFRAATPSCRVTAFLPPHAARCAAKTPRAFAMSDLRRYPTRYRATPAPRATAVRNSRDCIHHAKRMREIDFSVGHFRVQPTTKNAALVRGSPPSSIAVHGVDRARPRPGPDPAATCSQRRRARPAVMRAFDVLADRLGPARPALSSVAPGAQPPTTNAAEGRPTQPPGTHLRPLPLKARPSRVLQRRRSASSCTLRASNLARQRPSPPPSACTAAVQELRRSTPHWQGGGRAERAAGEARTRAERRVRVFGSPGRRSRPSAPPTAQPTRHPRSGACGG